MGGSRLTIDAVGFTAHAALARTGGRARVLARPSASLYLAAGDAIVWLGPATATMHPRAILGGATPGAGLHEELRVDVAALTPWRPATPALERAGVRDLGRDLARLATRVAALGAPGGFGARLIGAPLGFPLADAGEAADALARACADDEAAAAAEAAMALLGLGGGLTPSGDDFVGGALFGRRLLAAAGVVSARAWREVADAVLAAAPGRTPPISVALLGDLAAGTSHAPLHDLVPALAAGDEAGALRAAAGLVRLGHTSGWDILAGLVAGLRLTGLGPSI